MAGGRFRELLKKYGKVGLGVHLSVSGASIAGFYLAIKNNVDVEAIFEKVGIPGISKESANQVPTSDSDPSASDGFVVEIPARTTDQPPRPRNRTAELVASSGGALTLAVLLNKALFPVRVPITLALTPPIARFLARRSIIKNTV